MPCTVIIPGKSVSRKINQVPKVNLSEAVSGLYQYHTTLWLTIAVNSWYVFGKTNQFGGKYAI